MPPPTAGCSTAVSSPWWPPTPREWFWRMTGTASGRSSPAPEPRPSRRSRSPPMGCSTGYRGLPRPFMRPPSSSSCCWRSWPGSPAPPGGMPWRPSPPASAPSTPGPAFRSARIR
ncbi:hypothetical protein ACFFX0_15200 [Citricoccus parietis]|uniref:Uncharacterized protein n=1 Tax=Citricoccus parietis TaxID=592307 RepID=A0ABV5G0K9_9MICC